MTRRLLIVVCSLAGCGGGQSSEGPVHPPTRGADFELRYARISSYQYARLDDELELSCGPEKVTLAACFSKPEYADCVQCRVVRPFFDRAFALGYNDVQIEVAVRQRFKPKEDGSVYSQVQDIPLGDAVARGPADAPVTVVEFADFGSSEYRKVVATLDTEIAKRAASVRFVSRLAPRISSPRSWLAARAAIAADAQGRYWEMRDLLSKDEPLNTTVVLEHARSLGLELDRFEFDLSSEETLERLERSLDVARSEAIGIRATSAFFINGRRFNAIQDLGAWIDTELEQLRSSSPP